MWGQVEKDVGGTWLWQAVQESFEHNCIDAQQSGYEFEFDSCARVLAGRSGDVP